MYVIGQGKRLIEQFGFFVACRKPSAVGNHHMHFTFDVLLELAYEATSQVRAACTAYSNNNALHALLLKIRQPVLRIHFLELAALEAVFLAVRHRAIENDFAGNAMVAN